MGSPEETNERVSKFHLNPVFDDSMSVHTASPPPAQSIQAPISGPLSVGGRPIRRNVIGRGEARWPCNPSFNGRGMGG
jgi:hypothetical protein